MMEQIQLYPKINQFHQAFPQEFHPQKKSQK